jgi:hypothetical protein
MSGWCVPILNFNLLKGKNSYFPYFYAKQLFCADATIFKESFFTHKKLKKKHSQKTHFFFPYCLELPKQICTQTAKMEEFMFQNVLIDQLYIKLGLKRIVRPAGKNQSIVGNPYLPIGGHESQSRSRLCQTDIILGSVQCRCKVIDTKGPSI